MLKRICRRPGCAALVDPPETYCPKHREAQDSAEALRQKQYDQAIRLTRDAEYHAFYLSAEWLQLRDYVRVKYKGLCLWGYYHGGIIAPMQEVHHINPLKDAWEDRLLLANLIPLSCAAHRQVEAAYRRGDEGIKGELRACLGRWEKEFEGGGGDEKV